MAMPSAIVSGGMSADTDQRASDLRAVGVDIVGTAESADLLPYAIRCASDLIVCFEDHPDDALFSSTSALGRAAPRPVIVFTNDPDADKIDLAAKSGVHAYVINGYGLHRLRSIIHVAQARFRYDQLLREELTEVNQRFEERKLVDRAKGILMGARQMREEDAFRALRTAAMNTKQRIGQISRQIIDASRYAEAVNRSGQLRMFSQRLVKFYTLACADVDPAGNLGILSDSIDHVDKNLAIISKTMSKATFGDLVSSVSDAWKIFKNNLNHTPNIKNLPQIDIAAETLLLQAERLTTNLEVAGFATNLHVINVSGRQRMLSQRLAKQALLSVLSGDEIGSSIAAAEQEFVDALDFLAKTPLVTPDILQHRNSAEANWKTYRVSLHAAETPGGRQEIARLSEIILADFDGLTDAYERGIQMLFG